MGAEGLVEVWRGLGCGRVVLCGVEDDSEPFRVCLHEFDRALAVVQAGFGGQPKSRLPLSEAPTEEGLDNPLEMGDDRTVRAELEPGVPGITITIPKPQNLTVVHHTTQLLVRNPKKLARGGSAVSITDNALHQVNLILTRVNAHPNLLPFRSFHLLPA